MSLQSRHNITRTIVAVVLCASIFWRLLSCKCLLKRGKGRVRFRQGKQDRRNQRNHSIKNELRKGGERQGLAFKQEKWLEDYAIDQKSKELLLFLQAAPRYMKSGSFIVNKTIIIHLLTTTNIILCPRAVYSRTLVTRTRITRTPPLTRTESQFPWI